MASFAAFAHLGQRPVRALLAAEALSLTGSVMSALAVPWFVFVTTGSATRMTIVLAVEFAMMGVAGLFGGALAGRIGSRRTMLLGDLLRAPLIGAIPLLHWAGVLSFPVLLVLVAAAGIFYTPYIGAQQALLPDLVGEDEVRLGQMTSLLYTAERTAALAGPAIAGALIAAFGAPVVLLLDACSFLIAFLLVLRFVPRSVGHRPAEPEGAVLDGVRVLARDRLLGSWAIASGGFEVGWQMLVAALPVIAFARFDGDPLSVGAAMGALGGGAVAGGLLGTRLIERVPALQLALTAKVVQVVAFWGLVLALPLAGLAALLFFCGTLSALVAGPTATIRTLRVPATQRPAVGSAFVAVVVALGAVGLLAAGPLLDGPGWQATVLAAAVVQTAATLLFVVAGLRHGAAPAAQPAPA